MSTFCIILAAGRSLRFKSLKVFKTVLGEPLLQYSLKVFERNRLIKEVIIVSNKWGEIQAKNLAEKFKKVKKVVLGGDTRQDSCGKGLEALCGAKKDDVVVIHNAANPLVSQKEINEVIKAAKKYGAAVCGKKVVDTVKKVRNGFIEKTVPRDGLVLVQTPQAIKFGLLKRAFKKASDEGFKGTDDVSLVENLGEKVFFVKVSENNFKITTQADLERMKMILGDFRVGVGEDSHEFSDKGVLVLGGRKFKNYPKLRANSDGDVILHAFYNAISSAISEGSLGKVADKMCRFGIKDSRKYLEAVLKKMAKKGFKINNISLSIEANKPKFDPVASLLKERLSRILNIEVNKIGITATSGEGTRDFGEGIRCTAYVSLRDG